MAGHLFPERPPGRFFFGRKDGQDERARLLALILAAPVNPQDRWSCCSSTQIPPACLRTPTVGRMLLSVASPLWRLSRPGRARPSWMLGAGLGHLTIELSRAVGDAGKVIGVDPSARHAKGGRKPVRWASQRAHSRRHGSRVAARRCQCGSGGVASGVRVSQRHSWCSCRDPAGAAPRRSPGGWGHALG